MTNPLKRLFAKSLPVSDEAQLLDIGTGKEGQRAVSRPAYVTGPITQFTTISGGGDFKDYRLLRDNIPPLSRAITNFCNLLGTLEVTADEALVLEIEAFLRNLRVNQLTRGYRTAQSIHVRNRLTYGKSVTEIVPNNAGNDIYALAELDPQSIILRPNTDNVQDIRVLQKQWNQPLGVELDPYWTAVSLNDPEVDPHGVSLLRSIPYTGRMILDIEEDLRQTWMRMGVPAYHINWEPPEGFNDPTGEKSKKITDAIQSSFTSAMGARKSGRIQDFASAGKISVTIIGSEGKPLNFEIPYRALMEQIVAATGQPSWMLGFHWSTTERLSDNEADILAQTIGSMQELELTFWRRLVRLWLDLQGRSDEFELSYLSPSLHDAVETAKADLDQARAVLMRETSSRKLWECGVWDQLQYAEGVLGDEWTGEVALPMTEPPVAIVPANPMGEPPSNIPDATGGGSGGGGGSYSRPFPHEHDHYAAPSAATTIGQTEVAKDKRITRAITGMLGDILTVWRDFRDSTFKIFNLPTPAEFAAAETENPFTYTPGQKRSFNRAADLFIERMAGKDLTREGYVSAETGDGILQQWDRFGYALGVNRSREMTNAETAAINPGRDSTNVHQMLDRGFERLSESGTLKIGQNLDPIRQIINDGLELSMNPLDVAGELADTFKNIEGYNWERLARTEIAFAQNRGQMDEFMAEGYSNTLTEEPPYHPNCCLEGTLCKAPGGVIAGLRAWYSGPAIELILSEGRTLSVTINHMLLTPSGFVKASALREGDEVIYCPGFERVSAGDPNSDERPAPIEDVVGSLSVSSGMHTRTMPVSPKYLHGDGACVNGDIDIVRADGLFESAVESEGFQPPNDNFLDSGAMGQRPLFTKGSLAEVLFRAALATDGVMGGRGHAYSIFLRHLAESQSLGFASSSDADAGLTQYARDNVSTALPGLRDILDGSAGQIGVDKVSSVREFNFSGHVYDLQTYTTLYLANGVVSSNCLCATTIDPTTMQIVPDIAATACEICQGYAQ